MRALSARDFEVHVAALPTPGADDPGGILHDVDLLQPGSPAAVVDAVRPTHLVHMAWFVQPGQVWGSPENVRWVEASLELMRAFGVAGGERAVFAGTCSEYGHPTADPCPEDAPLAPTNLYGSCKAGLGQITLPFCEALGVSAAWARIFFAFGPHEHPVRLVSSISQHVLSGEEAPCSHGLQVRDYLATPEIGAALAATLESQIAGPVNVGSGVGITIAELARRTAEIAGRPELLRLGAIESGPNEPASLVADVGRLRSEVGWQPELTLEERLEQTVEWWRQAIAADSAA